ncbi:MAG: hypothetical protein ACI97A_002969 [Planctomycetota bacterium]|jgi:hypothetical protein
MVKVQKKPEVRSEKRVRLGARTFLILVMAIILGLLLAWVLGFRLPESVSSSTEGENEESPFQKTVFRPPNQNNPKTKNVPTYRPRDVELLGVDSGSDRNPNPESDPRHNPTPIDNAAMAQGPCWLSGRLPQPIAAEPSVRMTLVSIWGELGEKKRPSQKVVLKDGQFLFQASCQLAPIFLQVESSRRIDLFGPFTLTPFAHESLGALALPTIEIGEQLAKTMPQISSEFSWFAIPRSHPGLLAMPLVSYDIYDPMGSSFDSLLDWDERVTPITLSSQTTVQTNKDLGGPWELVALRGGAIHRTSTLQSDGKSVPSGRVRIEGLGNHDALIFRSAGEQRAYVIHNRNKAGIYSLPHQLGHDDALQFIRFGDQPQDLRVPDEPGKPVVVSAPGFITIDPVHLADFSLVRSELSHVEIDRVIKRNLLLFRVDRAKEVTRRVHEDMPTGEETVRQENVGGSSRTRLIQIPVNPGRYDVVQIANTKSGRRTVVGQIVVPKGHQDFVPVQIKSKSEGPRNLLVLDATTNEPVAGAGIIIGQNLPNSRNGLRPNMRTNAQGLCSLPKLSPAVLDLLISSPTHANHRSKIAASQFEESSGPLVIRLQRASPFEMSISIDENGVPTVDGIALIRSDGHVISRPATGSMVTFASLAPGRYVAIPYLGALSVTTDDWEWLIEESGGLVIDHGTSKESAVPQWKSPAPREVSINLQAQGEITSLSLQVVHAGVAPFPGVWPNQAYDDLPLGLIKLDRLLPGQYRAIATSGEKTDIADLIVSNANEIILTLQFDFTKD